ncbi:hypothetical protein KQX54_008636 [Cotesia glomerata]|uniref:Uncharacterized protein n=1 Tax=Cotesia glomerata TaxID=32391 RepID=A0AAV7HZU9_COTGL|nr:hypothetical protein KQX54_008636 [Cotesia glomerata]
MYFAKLAIHKSPCGSCSSPVSKLTPKCPMNGSPESPRHQLILEVFSEAFSYQKLNTLHPYEIVVRLK